MKSKRKLSKTQRDELIADRIMGLTIEDIREKYNISTSSIYNTYIPQSLLFRNLEGIKKGLMLEIKKGSEIGKVSKKYGLNQRVVKLISNSELEKKTETLSNEKSEVEEIVEEMDNILHTKNLLKNKKDWSVAFITKDEDTPIPECGFVSIPGNCEDRDDLADILMVYCDATYRGYVKRLEKLNEQI